MHVESSAITDIDYDGDRRRMVVRFKDGDEYLYVGVPPRVAHAFAKAPSKGRFFADTLRGRYPYHKLG